MNNLYNLELTFSLHAARILFITIYMNAYIIEMPSFKYESLAGMQQSLEIWGGR